MAFNQAQEKAIRHLHGPMMVLAGPGSGKTTVITHRVKFLVEEAKVNPSGILVITFTKAAATEMRERYSQLMGETAVRVGFGTFHAVFFQILKHAYGYRAENIVREDQRYHFVREMTDRLRLDVEDEKEFTASILGEISSVKGEMLDLEHYYAKSCSDETFRQLFTGYEERMRQKNLIDFDDMLVMCYQLFVERPDILSAWQKKFSYILIDEFQDINKVQYEIVKMLALPDNNLFIVGDDDQSIYRFRGAKPEIMLGFEKDYPNTQSVLLDVNYRSTKEILSGALTLIDRNKARFPKEIVAQKGHGKPIVTRCFSEPGQENETLVQELLHYQKAGYHFDQMAVLYRTNTGPRLLIEKLMEYNIPFKVKDALPNLYEHWIAQDLFAYIRLAKNGRERKDFLRIANRPLRYISRDALESPVVSFEAVKSFYQDKAWMVERVEQLEYDLSMIASMAPAAAINYIRKAVGYDDYLREYAIQRKMNLEDLTETLEQLKESGAAWKTWEEWVLHMEEYARQLKQQADHGNQQAAGVSLATMHSSKGLEYPIVYILDANEGITPHHKAVLDVDMEEERRLFYVAMTRAKERLHVYHVKERYHKPCVVSRFVEEYMEEKQ